jgi:Acetyltransferase (GNAT) domain
LAIKAMASIRPMAAADIPAVTSLVAMEGNNPGSQDVKCLYDAYPHGLFVAEADSKVAAFISTIAYDDSFGAIGLHIVSPACGEDTGRQLLKHGLDYLAKRNISINCLPGQQQGYTNYGFRASHLCRRYVGIAEKSPAQKNIVPVSKLSLDDIASYDTGIFAIDRPVFLKCWLRQKNSLALASLSNGRINGYGVMRQCRLGHRIGPLFANTAAAAEKLIKALTGTISGQPFFIDIPDANHGAKALIKQYSLSFVLEKMRMYAGKEPASPVGRVYGLTSLEIS